MFLDLSTECGGADQRFQLIRRRRIFSHTTVHLVPDDFIFIAIVPSSSKDKKLMKHLVCSERLLLIPPLA